MAIPTITAEPNEFKVGSKLTATITDSSIEPASLEYQWLADGVNISSAKLQTYTLTTDDIGKQITVKVSYLPKPLPADSNYEWINLIDSNKLKELYGDGGVQGIIDEIIKILNDSTKNALLIAALNNLYLSINGGTLKGLLELPSYDKTFNSKETPQIAATVGYVDYAIENFDISKLNGFDMGGFSGDSGPSTSTPGNYLSKVKLSSDVTPSSAEYSKTQIILPDHTKAPNNKCAASREYVNFQVSGKYLQISATQIKTEAEKRYVKHNLSLPINQNILPEYAISKQYADDLLTATNLKNKVYGTQEFKDAVNAAKTPSDTPKTSTVLPTINYGELVKELFKEENKAELLKLMPSITDEIINNWHYTTHKFAHMNANAPFSAEYLLNK